MRRFSTDGGAQEKKLALIFGKASHSAGGRKRKYAPPYAPEMQTLRKLAEFQGKWLRHSRKGEDWEMLWNTPFYERGPWGVSAGKKCRAPIRGAENLFIAGKTPGAEQNGHRCWFHPGRMPAAAPLEISLLESPEKGLQKCLYGGGLAGRQRGAVVLPSGSSGKWHQKWVILVGRFNGP